MLILRPSYFIATELTLILEVTEKLSNDWIYLLHIVIWQKNVSIDRIFTIIQYIQKKLKLLTDVSTSVAAAFTRTRGQQFWKKKKICQMTESIYCTCRFDRKKMMRLQKR